MATKVKQESINSQLSIVMKSGKTSIGFRSVLKAARNGQTKAVILASNLPVLRKTQIEYYCMLNNAKTIHYTGSNTDLGLACGKLYRISCMAINEVGDSDILGETKTK